MGRGMGLPSFSVNEALDPLNPFMELHPHISLSATLFLVKGGSRYSPHLTISTHDTGTVGTQIFLSILGGRHQVSFY